jgi:DNA-binding transcriptional LysR family regulator
MASGIDWGSQIGHRLRLRDLHVFFAVVQRGSMAKAAQQLNVTQPAVSRVIADLEHTLGVRLLDRTAQGVSPTMYGRALHKRGTVVFDELKQSIRDIEFLADPTVGEVRIGCPSETIAATVLPLVIQRFSQVYPRVVLYVEQLGSHMGWTTLELPALRQRSLDLAILRLANPPADEQFVDDLNVEVLFHDQLAVVAGKQSRWARRRKIDLTELINEPWILPGPSSWNYAELAEAFRARGVDMPNVNVVTVSAHLRTNLLAAGPFIATFPTSVLRFGADRFSLKELPIDLPKRPWPVAIVTLKNRTLSPVVERFIECAREVATAL